MRQQIFLLYRTDEHLANESKELLYIGNLPNCFKAAREFGASDAQIDELGAYRQSQLSNTDYEFIIEQYSLNDYVVEP